MSETETIAPSQGRDLKDILDHYGEQVDSVEIVHSIQSDVRSISMRAS